jgi:hypothetical protein
MATTYWTLRANGIEQTFETWGFSRLKRETRTQDMDTVTFDHAAAFAVTDDPVFPVWTIVTVYSGRTLNRDGTFSGGTRWFYGHVTRTPKQGSGTVENTEYTVAGPWWWLENRVYKQSSRSFWSSIADVTSGVRPAPSASTVATLDDVSYMNDGTNWWLLLWTSNVILNQRVNYAAFTYTKISTGQQIVDAVQFAAQNGAPIIIGSEFPTYDPLNPANGMTIAQAMAMTTGSPNLDVPMEQCTSLSCAEVIRKMMRWSPDAVVWFDYECDPSDSEPYPTIHCKTKASLNPVTIPFDQRGLVTHLSVDPRHDLVVPLVELHYDITSITNGQSTVTKVEETWPPKPGSETVSWGGSDPSHQSLTAASAASPGSGYSSGQIITIGGGSGTSASVRVAGLTSGGTGIATLTVDTPGLYSSPPDSPYTDTGGAVINLVFGNGVLTTTSPAGPPYPDAAHQFGALAATIDLNGPNATDQSATVKTQPIAAGNVAFWAQYYPWINDPEKGVAMPVVIRAYGRTTGTDSFPNMLLQDSAQLAPWMLNPNGQPVQSILDTIWCWMDITTPSGQIVRRELTLNVVATTALAGENTYGARTYSFWGEPIPTSLAMNMFNARAILQYAGDIALNEQEVTGILALGDVMNISAGNPAWTSMDAWITRVTEDVETGDTNAEFGPSPNLGAQDWIELLRVFRARTIAPPTIYRFGYRQANYSSVSGNITPTQNSSAQTTHTPVGVFSTPYLGGMDGTTTPGHVAIDTTQPVAGARVTIQNKNTDGTRDTTSGSIDIPMSGLKTQTDADGGGDDEPQDVRPGVFHFTDMNGIARRCVLPISQASDDPDTTPYGLQRVADATVTVGVGGSGYTVGDVYESAPPAAAPLGSPAKFVVQAVDDSGAVTDVIVVDRGRYNVDSLPDTPNNIVGTGITGTASGCQLDLTFEDEGVWVGGGGGGGETMLKVVSFEGDYLFCHTWDGTTEGNDADGVNVALPWLLRMSFPYSPRTVDGDTATYTTDDVTSQLRTSTIGGVGKYEVITERYVGGDVIWAVREEHTGVFIDEVELTMLDANHDGRSWALQTGQ